MKVIIYAAVIALAALPPSTITAAAASVMRGALEICEVIDGGTTQVGGMNGDIERCCARETSGTHIGRYYCVTCRPPGSQNCEEDYPNVRGTNVDALPSAPLVPTAPITGQSKP